MGLGTGSSSALQGRRAQGTGLGHERNVDSWMTATARGSNRLADLTLVCVTSMGKAEKSGRASKPTRARLLTEKARSAATLPVCWQCPGGHSLLTTQHRSDEPLQPLQGFWAETLGSPVDWAPGRLHLGPKTPFLTSPPPLLYRSPRRMLPPSCNRTAFVRSFRVPAPAVWSATRHVRILVST